MGEGLRWKSQQRTLDISWYDGGSRAMAVCMSMLAGVFVRCRRSVCGYVFVESLQSRAIVHKMVWECLKAKGCRRRTILSAMVVVVVQV